MEDRVVDSHSNLAEALQGLAGQAAALEARNAKLLADYERIEGEYQALKLRAEFGGSTAAPAPAPPTSSEGEVARLRQQNEILKRNCEKLEAALIESATRPKAEVPDDSDATRADKADYEAMEKELAALKATLEALEAEDEDAASEDTVMAKISRASLLKLRLRANNLASRNEKLEARLKKAKQIHGDMLESGVGVVSAGDESAELAAVKKKATRTIQRLKKEADSAKFQRDNLVKALESRDAGIVAGRELTLEEITESPVFKTMLGNIRRTSREEVTLLHDAVVALGETDPAAYNAVLPIVAARFEAANVENPLALLKKKPEG